LRILGIDTSSAVLSIAVARDAEIISERNIHIGLNHCARLVPEIIKMLKELSLSIKDVDGFIVGSGPGSFTGLRIGISTVKGFAIATKKPCLAIPSIDSIAMNIYSGLDELRFLAKSGRDIDFVVPVIDAKRGNVYSAIYKKNATRVIKSSAYLLMPVEKLMRRIKGHTVFLGDGLAIYRDNIHKIKGDAIFLEQRYWYPKASNLIKLGFPIIKRRKKSHPDGLVPLYLYAQDCQVKKL